MYQVYIIKCKACGNRRRVKGHVLGKFGDLFVGSELNWPCPCKGDKTSPVGGSVYEVVEKV